MTQLEFDFPSVLDQLNAELTEITDLITTLRAQRAAIIHQIYRVTISDHRPSVLKSGDYR